MKQPYSFELATEYSEEIANILLPARVPVTYNDELCCYTILNEDGVLEVLLPEGVYDRIMSGRARLTFPKQQHSPGEPEQLIAVEIYDVA